MKLTVLLVTLVGLSPLAHAQNLKCVSQEGTLILEKTAERSPSYYGKMLWAGGYGFFQADCQAVAKNESSTRLNCSIESDWGHHKLTGVVDLARDKKSAIVYRVKTDRRTRAGYKLENPSVLNCASTTETADRWGN